MISWTRSVRISSGKNMPQAMQWAKEMAEFVEKKHKIQVSVYMDMFGESGTIRWFCDYEDLAAMEKIMNQFNTDQEYWQRVSQASEFITQNSVHDTVMRSL